MKTTSTSELPIGGPDFANLQGPEFTAMLCRYAVAAEDFEDYMVQVGQGQPANAWLTPSSLRDDLLLAFACARSNAAALADFDAQCGAIFDAVCAQLRVVVSQRLDARQKLWQILFVGVERPPKIEEYRGRGPLAHWFRVTVSRFLLNEIRSTKRDRLVLKPDYSELDVASGKDPELAYLEQTYRRHFRAAFHQALSDLHPEQRNVLRCHYIHCMSIDQMADVYGVHRATAARRITSARGQLLTATCDYLRKVLGCDTEEIRSVIRRVGEESSLSISRLLGLGEATPGV